MKNWNDLVSADAEKHGMKIKYIPGVRDSEYKVAIVIRFMKKKHAYRFFEFVCEYNRFGATIACCKDILLKDIRNFAGNYIQMVAISQQEDASFELRCTSILSFICYLPDVEECYKRLPNQSLGFIISIDSEELLNTDIWCGTMKELENRYLKSTLN